MKTFNWTFIALFFLSIMGTAQSGSAYNSQDPEGITVPRGAVLMIRTSDRINTDFSRSGEIFRGTLASDITEDGIVVIPAGTEVEGRVIEAVRAKNLGRRARLSLEITHLIIDRQLIPITTYPLSSAGRSSKTGEKVGGGAVIGGVLGGWRGVKNGALIGLGVAAVTKGKQIDIPNGTLLEFEVRMPINLDEINY